MWWFWRRMNVVVVVVVIVVVGVGWWWGTRKEGAKGFYIARCYSQVGHGDYHQLVNVFDLRVVN